MQDEEITVAGSPSEKGQRSASYPGLTLDEAIEFANLKVYKNYTNTVVKREEVARLLDVHPNTLARHFAACVQFGLFSKEVGGYKVTALFDRIVNPENA